MVSVVLDNLAAGQTPDEIVRLYPTLHGEDVAAAMGYAAELARERVVLTAYPPAKYPGIVVFRDPDGNLLSIVQFPP